MYVLLTIFEKFIASVDIDYVSFKLYSEWCCNTSTCPGRGRNGAIRVSTWRNNSGDDCLNGRSVLDISFDLLYEIDILVNSHHIWPTVKYHKFKLCLYIIWNYSIVCAFFVYFTLCENLLESINNFKHLKFRRDQGTCINN